MRFAYPEALLLLLLLLPLLVLTLRRGRAPLAIGFPVSGELRHLPPSLALRLHRALPWLRALALGLAVLAVAGPQWGVRTTSIAREGIAIALVIDTSSSMSAIDLTLGDRPSSRLEVVKATLRDFVTGGEVEQGGRAGDAIGMVTFARYADTISPPTLDHEALLGLLDQVAIVAMPTEDGTAIGDAIVRAIDMLERADGASKAIILLTDGSYNAGEAEPLVAAQLAAAYGIRLNAIGAGSRGTALMPVAAPDGGTEYLSSEVTIDEATLEQVAGLTGGKYFRATDAAALRAIYAEIDRLEKAPNVAEHQQRYIELYPLVTALVLSLLLLEIVMITTRLRTIPLRGARDMRFEAWSAIYLLALVPALLLLYAHAFRRQRQALAAFVEHELAPRVLPWAGSGRRWARALCLVAAAACLIVALMQPQWGRGARTLPLLGRDVIVLLDVSYSMLAEDAVPNRLARAKAAVRDLALAAQRDGGHRLGLLTFAGRADVLCPLTRDYRLFLKRLDDASADAVGRRGTSIGEALRRSVRAFGELTPGYTDLVLVTDGEDHEGLPLEAAAMVAGLQLRLHTVGVGDPERSVPIPIAADAAGHAFLVQDGREVQTRMREGLLVGMADAAGGVQLTLEDGAGGLDRLYAEHIAGQPRRELEAAGHQELSPRYQYFLLLAVVLLVLEMLIRRPRGDRAPRDPARVGEPATVPARGRVWAGLLAFLPILGADQAAQAVREGNQLYQAGQYEAALRAYRAAAETLPDATPGAATIDFNQGNALFKSKDEEQALDRYLAALTTEDPGLAGRAKYNIGVIKYRQALAAAQRYEDALTFTQAAVRYFRESLDLDGGLADARYNLELAYRLQRHIETQLLRAQQNAEEPIDKSSLRRGQAFSDQIRNEGGGQRRSLPNEARQPHGQRGNETPENFAANQESSEPPKSARLPMAMGADVAHQLMEQLRERLQAAEVRRQEQRRKRLQQAEEQTPW